jgi:GntR family transcriptional regulator, transcriptional repressor for pyruvate dehydrogenase complex
MADEPGGYKPAYRRVVDQVIEYIAERGLRPSDRLPTEMELAAELGESQRAVREAIKMLSAIGRVRVERGRGIFVGDDRSLLTGQRPVSFRPTDLAHISMLFEFRSIQESETARLAAGRATPPDMKALETAVADGQQAVDNGDLGLFVQSDDAFHHALAEASHNIFLIDAVSHIRALQGQVSFLELGRNISNADRAVKEHGLILDAVRSGEVLLAAERAGEHVQRSLQDYRDAIERRLEHDRT